MPLLDSSVAQVMAESEADAIEATLVKEAIKASAPPEPVLSDWVSEDEMDAAVRLSMEQYIADAVKSLSQTMPPPPKK